MMQRHSKVNKFEDYQLKRVAARKHLLKNHLEQLRSSRTSFTNVTDLAKLIAQMITESDRASFSQESKENYNVAAVGPKPCNTSTLLRNPEYRALLYGFMADSSAKGTSKVSLNPRAFAEYEAKFIENELKISNQANEIKRLKIYIIDLSTKLNKSNQIASPLLMSDQQDEKLNDANNAASLCKTIVMILDHYKELITIDSISDEILDPSLRRNNVVVDAKTAKPFFEWFKKLKT